jgi:hypothetical protein
VVATSKVRDDGIERNLMKFVVVTQWVRTYKAQVPPDQSLASRSVTNPRTKPAMEVRSREVVRMQAALLSPEMSIVVDNRITS